MGFVKFYLENRTADDVIVEGGKLTFKVRFFKFRLSANIMATIEGGELVLNDKVFCTELQYKILLTRIFIIAAIIPMVGFLFMQSPLVFIMFLLFCGVTWIIAVIRHHLILINMANGIEVLLSKPWKSHQLEDELYCQIINGETINS